MTCRSRIRVVLAACLALASPAGAEPTPEEILSPVVVSVIAPPVPFAGADGRTHLAYEILVTNQSAFPVRLESVETLDASSDAVVATLRGADLEAASRIGAGDERFEPYQSGKLFLDVTFADAKSVPRALAHRFVTALGAPPKPVPGPKPPATITFVGAPVDVSQQAPIVLSPPLAGPRWVAVNGCCKAITSHRGATLSVNGTIRVAERFAIDFVQLQPDGHLTKGPAGELASYPYFGSRVYAAADGVVVGVEDAMPEEVPGKLPETVTAQTAAGNHVVQDLGEGRFALYAHLQPGSLRVKVGDRVKPGQLLGLLGNSGNTDAPHLHFHVMDGPSPLNASGLPYVFDRFYGEGVVRDEDALESGRPATIDAAAMAGAHRAQLPMNLEVVSFPGPLGEN